MIIIAADGSVLDVYALRPLPALDGAGNDARTLPYVGVSSGFGRPDGAIIVYPPCAGGLSLPVAPAGGWSQIPGPPKL